MGSIENQANDTNDSSRMYTMATVIQVFMAQVYNRTMVSFFVLPYICATKACTTEAIIEHMTVAFIPFKVNELYQF